MAAGTAAETHLIAHGHLNSPWGLVIAPAGFGAFGGDLLVGNFGDGAIHAYNLTTGVERGQLTNTDGNPILINGLWALRFGNNLLRAVFPAPRSVRTSVASPVRGCQGDARRPTSFRWSVYAAVPVRALARRAVQHRRRDSTARCS